MESYRKKLKTQNCLYAVGAIALIAVQALAYMGVVSPIVGDSHFVSFWNGFIAGAAAGVTVVFIVGIIINIRALRSEERLKALYIKENDERTAAIRRTAQSVGVSTFVLLMLPAIIIAGYFNIAVFFTCLSCELALCLMILFCKLYYSKKL